MPKSLLISGNTLAHATLLVQQVLHHCNTPLTDNVEFYSL